MQLYNSKIYKCIKHFYNLTFATRSYNLSKTKTLGTQVFKETMEIETIFIENL